MRTRADREDVEENVHRGEIKVAFYFGLIDLIAIVSGLHLSGTYYGQLIAHYVGIYTLYVLSIYSGV